MAKPDETVPDAESTAQVVEAKEKLGAADEKLQTKMGARKKTEKRQEKQIQDMEQTVRSLETIKERRVKLIEAVKERNSELREAQRAESSAQQRLEKAHHAHNKAIASVHAAKQNSLQNDALSQTANAAVADALTQ